MDPFYADRMLEIDARAKAREEKLVKEAEDMSKNLNFDDVTKAVADYEQVGSAKGIKVKKKKKAKKAKKPEAISQAD